MPRLFHFSDDPAIEVFEPRPVRVPAKRPPGMEWLNGPLVWAIDDAHQPMYLFPRDCPRILIWPLDESTPEDMERWWVRGPWRMIAYVETAWVNRLNVARIYRYELPEAAFRSLDDAGMWVSTSPVRPLDRTEITDLPAALAEAGAKLTAVPRLGALRDVLSSSLHSSGIRLRNAANWTETAIR